MTLNVGDKLPDANLLRMGADGPEAVSLASLLDGRNVVLFALPGAYTGTCTTAHVPSYIRTKAALNDAGVDDVICVSVNDPFVMGAWSDSTGAGDAGVLFLADSQAEFTKAVGMDFTAPPVGLVDRSQRYSAYVVDGEVKILHAEENPGVCETSAGEAMLDAIKG
ncbi:Peroxiredoxin [Aliiroseovarius halocynthiae]|uniref:Glutathione-dependent peroxiredoxin n=1 Tax=Aliiroseovarius halocynthiae TaxID=985055 RepID=A0A545SZH5_9RHOB|nr:peroxiredoxin [Aliiroseovarius halocynthiae]TQV70374.1 peroxiredoxin [Aliiroseovarius halocynthiae]SMR81918.1 Peroxiredoxin [Aliiroseovarius halocynthiae]